MNDKNLEEKLITQQQESAYKEWLADDHNPLDFWDFYQMWCLERGYYFDRQSSQYDD